MKERGDSEPSGFLTETERKDSKTLIYGYEADGHFNLPITVAVVILIIYILVGAFMYTLWGDWNYLVSFYFVFISISTIGYCDVLPAHPIFLSYIFGL